jgi:hypothetical protein
MPDPRGRFNVYTPAGRAVMVGTLRAGVAGRQRALRPLLHVSVFWLRAALPAKR